MKWGISQYNKDLIFSPKHSSMSKPFQKLKINLFGELWTLKKVLLNPIEQEYFENIAARLKLTLHQALLDPFFYHQLRLNKISSIDKLPSKEVGGLMYNSSHQIEFWINGKKTEKIYLQDLEPSQYLFPLYQVKKAIIKDINAPGIYIEQKEKGFIGSYETVVENFSMDDFNFSLLEINNHLLLDNITHQHAKMVFKKKETLITYQNSYEIAKIELE
jgi:hypothetical protein